MRSLETSLFNAALLALTVTLAQAETTYSWRYYRVGNTGIQGDYNEAVWIAPDGDPYIGGYDPIFEEGGFAKFIQSENCWVNYSNVDYPIIGHPNDTGCTRVTDIVPDALSRLWMGTRRGVLRYDPAVGAGSLIRFGPGNSPVTNETVFDVERAPDGTLWFANNGCIRYDPANDAWTRWDAGNVFLGAQPKAGGGYYVWSADRYFGYVFRYDSAAGMWTNWLPQSQGEVAGMPGKDCVDDAGNFWAFRMPATPGDWETLEYRRPDGTWVSPAPPYPAVTYDTWAFNAYGDRLAVLVDGNGYVYQFSGTNWISLGQWRPGAYTYSADVDAAGNVWVSGVGGAAKRDAQTGQWQRYRITNTGNYDDFNRDLTIDTENDYIYTGANAAPGVGGMTRFDGQRWVGWNNSTYGLGWNWPFPNDYCTALAYRSSTGRIAVSPLNWLYGIHEWTGSGFNTLLQDGGAQRMCEDSQGRLWALGEYYSLTYYDGNGWTDVPVVGWGTNIRKDPTAPGTVWTITGYQILRTDGGTYNFSRTIADFQELTDNTDQFLGLATAANGVAWVGATALYDGPTPGGALIRIDANTGAYQMLRSSQGWPFPGDTVTPWAVTPDGRLWMQYDDSNYPYTERGLCWWDGTNVGAFPAPPGGEPQWGGLPHAQIDDVEVRVIPGGYELWMSCVSRGLAVLTVQVQDPSMIPGEAASPTLSLGQNWPNPFRASTRIAVSLPREGPVQITVCDVIGRVVRTLVHGFMTPGQHEVVWDGKDDDGRSVASGVYLYRLDSQGSRYEGRMTLLR